jgi:CrcB protein
MYNVLLVAAGGALGAGARHLVSGVFLRQFGSAMPWGTLVINVTGSLLIGVLVGWLAFRGGEGQAQVRYFLATGVLGGFTTFSAFSLETVQLIERGRMASALVYALGSVALGAAGVVLGLWISRRMFA